MINKLKILVIGSGAREHALVWKISQSKLVGKIYCAPGNGGTAKLAENIDIPVDDIITLANFAQDKRIDLTVVGPEIPLVKGIVDLFESKQLKIFGPRKNLANLEGSKIFAKEMMKKFNIPTADFKIFSQANEAKQYIQKKGVPIVIKADGLCAGKGVVVAKTIGEAEEAIDLMLVKKEFGAASNNIIVEDCLEGEEASIIAICDGKNIVPLVSSQDHKRLSDNDLGPNTGGMGAYAPAPIVTAEISQKVMEKVFKPLIAGLSREKKIYKGVLYAGIMIKNNEPYVLEFNARFGDPETQVILPKLNNDLVELILKAIDGQLDKIKISWDKRFCLTVVIASGGYPGKYVTGLPISGLEKNKKLKDVIIFHAGTKRIVVDKQKQSKLQNELVECLTSGGRVLNVTSLGRTIKEAQNKVYKAIENISFVNMYYRKDIGNKALKN